MFDYAKLATLCSIQILALWHITRKGLFLPNTAKQCTQQLQWHRLVKSIDQGSGTFLTKEPFCFIFQKIRPARSRKRLTLFHCSC